MGTNDAAYKAVDQLVYWAVRSAAFWTAGPSGFWAATGPVGHPVDDVLRRAGDDAVDAAAPHDPPHHALADFLSHAANGGTA